MKVRLLACLYLSPSLLVDAGDFKDALEPVIPREKNHSISALVNWESRYVLEGRDILDGEGLSSSTFEFEADEFLLGAWLARSAGADYEERNFYTAYSIETGPLEWYASYMFLQFPKDTNVDDNEVGAGVAAPEILFGLTPALDWYYSNDADGSFMEASLAKEIPVTDRFHFEPVIVVGRNDGYIGDGHDGANHVALSLFSHFHISERMALQAHISQSWAIDANPAMFADDSPLTDFLHGGVGISISF